jgi:hypothetical protein
MGCVRRHDEDIARPDLAALAADDPAAAGARADDHHCRTVGRVIPDPQITRSASFGVGH